MVVGDSVPVRPQDGLVIEARVNGHDARRAERHYDTAVNVAAKARRDLSIQKDVALTLRARTVASVRARLTSEAKAKLEGARLRYDRALDGVAAVPIFIAELQAARTAEAAAASELASAIGETPGIGSDGSRRDRASGRARQTTAEDVLRLVLVIDQPDGAIQLGDEGRVRQYLARRSEPPDPR